MTEPLPPTTLAWLRHAASCGQRDAQLTLHTLEHLEALEKKNEIQRLAILEWGKDVDKLERWIDLHLTRIMALEQRPIPGTVELAAPAPEAAPVATDQELLALYRLPGSFADSRRAVYNLGRKHGAAAAQSAPPVAPAGGLVERVATAMQPGTFDWSAYESEARSAIREVARFLGDLGYWAAVADLLEQVGGR
jgi:hypothetical protein